MTKKLCLVFMLTITAFCVIVACIPMVKTTRPQNLTVVIDAGHGGIDSGAMGKTSSVKESEINLSVSNKLKNLFESAGISVVMTRSSSLGLYGVLSQGFKKRDLSRRVEIINGADADLFISIHMNEYRDDSRRGAQVFYKNDVKSKNLAKLLQTELDKIDTDPRDGIILSGDYYLLNQSKIPSVICECGFLSNPQDERLLITENYQDMIAHSIYLGACAYFYENASNF